MREESEVNVWVPHVGYVSWAVVDDKPDLHREYFCRTVSVVTSVKPMQNAVALNTQLHSYVDQIKIYALYALKI